MSETPKKRSGWQVTATILLVLFVLFAGTTVWQTYQLSQANSQITSLKTEGTVLNATIDLLKSEVTSLNNIAILNASTLYANDETISQGASQSTSFTYQPKYAGYVTITLVNFGPIRTDTAIVECIWNSNGIRYDSGQSHLSVGQSIAYPVLPTSTLTILVGNGYYSWYESSATETVTIAYTY